ncbi:putative phosphoglycerate mutase [Deinococcus metalli]|uniref:Phosphoglycerate mutase n=1 Tax=Deinococcus metalli TaxID=1141878 RepID=A0A7W8KG92_9DEIO|nr:histidine phosphatase family protein [Deinococcus metalli]MBB5375989.1 putative phosphoglycerate mutase [Deinococcus metalli]GHF41645.1 phosphoglycerate mutase [Deinococcus metalli]
MKLVLARHGESAGNVAQVFRGPDSQHDGLTDAGHAQARALGRHLATLALPGPRVYASTYRRAQDTAQAVAGALGTDVTVLDGVHEVDCGAWVGRAYADMRTHRGEVLGPDGCPAFPGGESGPGVAARFRAALTPLLAPGRTPIVVSHGFALSAALIDLLGADPAAAWADDRYHHGNAAYTLLSRENGAWHVETLAAQG